LLLLLLVHYIVFQSEYNMLQHGMIEIMETEIKYRYVLVV
jgi:hypothetical protein